MGLSRSEQMARIRGRDTGPERLLRSALWARGLRFRLAWPGLGCRPDLVIPSRKVAVFVDGCFWHGCPDHYVRPRSSAAFWSRKLKENVCRDRAQSRRLGRAGWTVLRFWEHDVWTRLPELLSTIERIGPRTPPRNLQEAWRVLSANALDDEGRREKRVLVTLATPRKRRTVTYLRHTRKW
jgi:DNA mismatch endonuclease (patch repair protein)